MSRWPNIARAAVLLLPVLLHAADPWKPPAVTVGHNLQAAVSVILPQAAPAEGAQITVTSDDPARAVLATGPERAGAAEIVIPIKAGARVVSEFWVRGLADSGETTYTIAAPGIGSGKGVVKLAPSGLALVGPFRLPSFPTTPRSPAAKLTVVSALLDSSHKIVEEQPLAGGLTVKAPIVNSNSEAGVLESSTVTIAGGQSMASTLFKPMGVGAAKLTIQQPQGFTTPVEFSSVTASVEKPGVAITDEFTLGKDLQMLGILCLGEAAPPGGLEVTLTSSEPEKLVLSAAEHELGTGVLKVRVPEGALTAQYYLQALASSGSVTYRATAEGFRHRIGKIELAPSGFIVAYERYGPPDEAAVLRAGEAHQDERRFFVSLAEGKEKPLHLAVYSAYLDPKRQMAADITVQPLRAGVSATILLKSSNPAVGSVESPLKVQPGTNRVLARFLPLSLGETTISIATPNGFSAPANATFAPATVMP